MATDSSFEPVIGLEVHAQLATRTKLFCGCENASAGEPNRRVCPVCLGYPGELPMLNGRAVELAVRLALACGCRVRETSVFARKNYFYPDLPKGYQITQYDRPLAERGAIRVEVDGQPRATRIRRIHLEEDAGKLLHDNPFPDVPESVSLVDFNRAGVPLVEIVTEPDLRSAEEVHLFLAKLRQILLYTGASEANLEEGNLRCDANVSLRPTGSLELGTRVELKNLNSFRFLRQAIAVEIERQARILEAGGAIRQETRLYDSARGVTTLMRSKEEEEDYRYFPDPDLPPLLVPAERIAALLSALPELPDAKVDRWTAELGLAPAEAEQLALTPERAARFDDEIVAFAASLPEVAAGRADRGEAIRVAARFETGVVAALSKGRDDAGESRPTISAAAVLEAAVLVAARTITFSVAKGLLERSAASGEAPRLLVEREGLAAIRDETALGAIVAKVVAANPKQAAEVREGKEQVLGFLVGQVMRETRGAADGALVQRLLREALGRQG